MSSAQLLRQCPEFAAFEEFILGESKRVTRQGELPAHITAITALIAYTRHNAYDAAQPLRVRYAAQDPTQVDGYLDYIPFEKVADVDVTAATASPKKSEKADKPAAVPAGVVTLTVGCTYFFVHEDELRRVLEQGTHAKVLGLRPKVRRLTQRTGLWFIDVAAADVPKFLAMDRCMLMHHKGTFVYQPTSAKALRSWTNARDAATTAVDPKVKGMKPMTIEASYDFAEEVAKIMASCQPRQC